MMLYSKVCCITNNSGQCQARYGITRARAKLCSITMRALLAMPNVLYENEDVSCLTSSAYVGFEFRVGQSYKEREKKNIFDRAYYAKADLQIDLLLLFREIDTFEKIVELRRIKMTVPFHLKIEGNGLCYSCCRCWVLGPCCPGGLAALAA